MKDPAEDFEGDLPTSRSGTSGNGCPRNSQLAEYSKVIAEIVKIGESFSKFEHDYLKKTPHVKLVKSAAVVTRALEYACKVHPGRRVPEREEIEDALTSGNL